MTEPNERNLAAIANRIPVPTYDREEIGTAIVHFGIGGFHRAHQAWYLDRLLEQGGSRDWGICGVGVLPGDRRMRDVLAAQDGLYTLCVAEPGGEWTPRVIGAIVEYLYAPDDPEAVVETLADPNTRIVSLTITEGGYRPELAQDATAVSVFGLVTAAFARRRARGLPPFTVMSCDNIPDNGAVAREAFVAFARRQDAGLAEWISREGAFPSSMVDRITPGTTPAMIAELRHRFDIADGWPVLTEPFDQWVLEDEFPLGRPEFDLVGVQLVTDVAPYELMKLRLLNGGHQALAFLGYLAGHRMVHDALADPPLARFLSRYLEREARPTLRPVPGIDLAAYCRTLLERFGNPAIADTIARLCADASERIPKWVVPVILDRLDHDGDIDCGATVLAAWARYCEGVDEQGDPIEIVDPRRDRLLANALSQRHDPLAFLADRDLFGDLIDNPRFVASYRKALDSLITRGATATLTELIGE
ncbi:mannitol dehydrogenase family protein [Nocardia sp. NPDC051030]|uniref:mannitol dehydrogenase family protein n=1 Tax=Nocardia sp. NPDC051030 TaxID=3155162 RepID=UPI0034154401